MLTPDYYLPIMPYLILDKVEEFIKFTKAVFNAEERNIIIGEDGETIKHGEVVIGKAVIMFTDSSGHYSAFPAGMFIQIENIDKIFNLAMTNGAICLQGVEDRVHGRSAGFQDKFGNQWWLSQPKLI